MIYMKKKNLIKLLYTFLFASFVFTNPISAQKKTTRILFLLDASGSMLSKLDKETRIVVAKRLLSNIVDSLKTVNNLEIALRVFGHQNQAKMQDCNDTKLEVPFTKDNHDLIKEKLKKINPKGTTLIAHSLTMCGPDFPVDPLARNIIILITDGMEECKGDPCAVSEALQKAGVVLKPFVIGLASTVDFKLAYQCVGRFYNATTEESFNNVLRVVIAQAMNNTTVQVNLIDAFGRAVESNVPITFYNMQNGQLEYNFVHTLNDRALPDTLSIEPTIKYRLVVHTIPEVVVENIELQAGRHNVIPVDVPQGSLQLIVGGLNPNDKVQCLVRKAKEYWTLSEQDFNTTRKYITGLYDLEVLTLPRIYLKEISIDAYQVTKIEIPTPGKLSLVSFNDVYGAIYQWSNNKLEWVCDLDEKLRRKIITLQPTLDKPYKLIYRYKQHTRAYMTFEKDFEIKSGLTTSLSL